MLGRGRAGGVAEPDGRARGMGDDGGADSARGGEDRPGADADHGGAGEASGARGADDVAARQPEPAAFIPAERADEWSASGNAAKVLGGEMQFAAIGLGVPAVGRRNDGVANEPFRDFGCVGRDGAEGDGEREFVLQQSLTPNDHVCDHGTGAAIAVDVGTQIWLEVDFQADYAVTRRRASVPATAAGAGFRHAVCLYGRLAGPGADDDVHAYRLSRGERLRRWTGR